METMEVKMGNGTDKMRKIAQEEIDRCPVGKTVIQKLNEQGKKIDTLDNRMWAVIVVLVVEVVAVIMKSLIG